MDGVTRQMGEAALAVTAGAVMAMVLPWRFAVVGSVGMAAAWAVWRLGGWVTTEEGGKEEGDSGRRGSD